MIDHVGFKVSDFAKSKKFYEAALKCIGYAVIMGDDAQKYAGFGGKDGPDFWIVGGTVGAPAHVALRADNRAAVGKFHADALAAGGRDNGKPGPRPEYTPTYYGAFVLDPDGNNVEVVCHAAQ